MFIIRAFAESTSGKAGVQRTVNNITGVNRKGGQAAFYRRTGLSGLGGNARTRGRLATIRPVRGR